MLEQPLPKYKNIPSRGPKDGTNLEFHSNRISLKFRIRIEYRIEYDYSVPPNRLEYLTRVEVSCRDAASSGGQVRARVIGIATIHVNLFVYFLT